jgi:hypothetical protein
MSMTHYMSLLAENQPWNLIFFMAIPVIFAETITITEFFVISGRASSAVKSINRWASVFVGIYFLGVVLFLIPNAVVPLTLNQAWHGWVDVLAVGAYLSGVLFLLPLALLDLRWIGKSLSPEARLKRHFILVGGFLVVAHVAMIFGMVNPIMTHTM